MYKVRNIKAEVVGQNFILRPRWKRVHKISEKNRYSVGMIAKDLAIEHDIQIVRWTGRFKVRQIMFAPYWS